MNSITHLSCVFATFLIVNHIYTSELTIGKPPKEPPIVVACDFGVISKNAETGNIISDALKSATHILRCLSWSSLAVLPKTTAHMKERGIEIAKTTPGITNTIKKLVTELQAEKYGIFTPDAVACLNEMGVNPVPDRKAILLLSKVKGFKIPTIGMGTQDSAEYEIYERKMLQDHKIHVPKLFDGIVTIPTLQEMEAFNTEEGYFSVRNPQNPRWLVSHDGYESPCFLNTIKKLGADLAQEAPIWSVRSIEELAILANALHRVHEKPAPLSDTRKMFDDIMAENQVIAPTKV
jgi:hypothetical protein